MSLEIVLHTVLQVTRMQRKKEIDDVFFFDKIEYVYTAGTDDGEISSDLIKIRNGTMSLGLDLLSRGGFDSRNVFIASYSAG